MELLAIFNLDLEHVQRWMEAGGYVLLFSLLFCCGLGLPLPEDIPLTLAGYFVQQGKMNLAIASVLAWCGIIGGDCVLYYLGRRFGLNITKVPFIGKHVTTARIEQAERWFEKYGVLVVGVCRLLAGVRGAMVVAAGTIRFNFFKFVIADGLAALVSGGAFIALGYFGGKWLGSPKEIAEKAARYQWKILIGILIAGLLVGLYIWWRSRRHKTLAQAVVDKIDEQVGHVEHRRPAAERR